MNELSSTILNDTDVKSLRPGEWTEIPEVKSGSETWSGITESISNGRSFESLDQEVDKILTPKTIEDFKKVLEEMDCTKLPVHTQEQLQSSEYSKTDNTRSFSEGTDHTEKKELSSEEKLKIKEETGWSDEIVDHIKTKEQYEIYKNANLVEAEINGRKCLIKADFDLTHVDPKTGLTNKELMEKGRSPIDPKTGEKIELHHMGQEYDAPFVELTESEHGGTNHTVLHPSSEDSWRNDESLKNKYNNCDRPDHWKGRVGE